MEGEGSSKEADQEREKEREKEQQRQRMLRRSRSAVELRGMGNGLARHGSTPDLQQHGECFLLAFDGQLGLE